MCKKEEKDMGMTVDRVNKNKTSQSQSFLKLRRKMQNQMKKENISYEDILKMTEDSKRDE